MIISTKGHVYLTENIHTDHSLNNIFHGSMNVEVRDHIQYAPSLRRAVKIISHSNQITYSQIMIQVQYFQLRLHSRVRRQRNIQNVLMKYSSTASKPHCASSPQEFNNILRYVWIAITANDDCADRRYAPHRALHNL